MPDRALTWSIIGDRTMPPKATWVQRLPEILGVLRSMDASHLDRQAEGGYFKCRIGGAGAFEGFGVCILDTFAPVRRWQF